MLKIEKSELACISICQLRQENRLTCENCTERNICARMIEKYQIDKPAQLKGEIKWD